MRLKLKKLVGDFLFLAIVLLIISRFIFIGTGRPIPIAVITGTSMEPTFYRGDVIIWTPVRLDDVNIGDVIVYESSVKEGQWVAHRVIDELPDGRLETKGDANEYSDQRGPHEIEPFVDEEYLLGRVVSAGNYPLKLPYIGYIWLYTHGFINSISSSVLAGQERSYAVFIPLVIAVCAIILCVFFLKPAGSEEKKKIKLTKLVLGPERLPVRRIFIIALIIFLVLILSTSMFAFSTTTIGVGLYTDAPEDADLSIPYFVENRLQNCNLTSQNTGLFSLKCFAFADGKIKDYMHINQTIYAMHPGQIWNQSFQIYMPNGTPPGVYRGTLYVYSSPFWFLLPNSVMDYIASYNPKAAVIWFDILAALILTLLSVSFIIIITKAIDEIVLWRTYWSAKPKMIRIKFTKITSSIRGVLVAIKSTFKRWFGWLLDLDWTTFKPYRPFLAGFSAALFIPLALLGYLVLAVIFSAFISAIIAYLLGARWRSEIIFAGIVGACINILVSALLPVYSEMLRSGAFISIGIICQTISIVLVVLLIFILPVCFISYATAFIIHRYRERRDISIIVSEPSDI